MVQRNWKLSSLKPRTISTNFLREFLKASHNVVLNNLQQSSSKKQILQRNDHRGNQSWKSGTSNFKQSLVSINYHLQPKISPKFCQIEWNESFPRLSQWSYHLFEADLWHTWWSFNLNLANLNRHSSNLQLLITLQTWTEWREITFKNEWWSKRRVMKLEPMILESKRGWSDETCGPCRIFLSTANLCVWRILI